MENFLEKNLIKVFVFGTLRKKGRLDYYMDGSVHAGDYFTEGQLMKSEIGSAYIDFTGKNVATIGEVHYINYPGLLRINHLESTSGEFPKGYDLDLLPVWKMDRKGKYKFEESEKELAFFYSRRNDPVKVKGGDWIHRRMPVDEIGNFLQNSSGKKLSPEDIIKYMKDYLQYE